MQCEKQIYIKIIAYLSQNFHRNFTKNDIFCGMLIEPYFSNAQLVIMPRLVCTNDVNYCTKHFAFMNSFDSPIIMTQNNLMLASYSQCYSITNNSTTVIIMPITIAMEFSALDRPTSPFSSPVKPGTAEPIGL